MLSTDSVGSQAVLDIAIGDIVPDPSQPRQTIPEEEVTRLTGSIAELGVMQPIRVKYDPVSGKWIIISGVCRWLAGSRAGLTTLPCLPWEGEANEATILLAQLAENTARNGLKPMELARAIARAKMMKKCSGKELAAWIGLSGGAISKAEALLNLPEDVQAMVDAGLVSAIDGYHISRLPDVASMRDMAHAVAERKLIGDAVADAVREAAGKKQSRPTRQKLHLPLSDGSLSLASNQPITWDSLLAALDRIRKLAKAFQAEGGDISELGDRLRAK